MNGSQILKLIFRSQLGPVFALVFIVLLFVGLATVMLATRRVDWYGVSLGASRAEAEPALK